MLEWINSPFARSIEKWFWEHPKTTSLVVICIVVFGVFPQAFNGIWYLFSTNAPVPTIAKTISWGLPAFHVSASWVTGPIAIALLIAIFYLLYKGKRVSEADASKADIDGEVKEMFFDKKVEGYLSTALIEGVRYGYFFYIRVYVAN